MSLSVAETEPETERRSAPAVHKAFAILDLVSREAGISFTAIHKTLSLPKSSAHQLISALCELGALQVTQTGGYMLGLRLCELGSISAGQRSIEHDALPYLRALAHEVQMTCHLGILEGRDAIYLAKVESEQAIKIHTWVGKRLSLYRSSLGKVLLAWRPEAEQEKLLADITWERKMPNTLPDAAAVRAHLAQVRARGWAVDDEEDLPNIRCVAAPIFDGRGNVIAALSAVGTTLQLRRRDFPRLAERVCAVARDISRALGPQ
ncbi:IclR family transcriptional regulator [Rhodovastum atsumiense]|uniref:IclR family transcriptional regulator n=1 Tax=Rhodovastum atsumiense TaxID=504468 RepID=A0A5M6J0A7_9PROT|nr:IclR family transcriptional regulator [Rhodovastum atsumiense]KAA5613517.1 IclR family transcriptional regulator [Rhodovastum atsumiense]CAH2603265.1 IclR family transcriptional regulator [Rhodovastum atsumiense]